jgi:hypothetical protein
VTLDGSVAMDGNSFTGTVTVGPGAAAKGQRLKSTTLGTTRAEHKLPLR